MGKEEVWLTIVTNDDRIISALVLAESLKRTRTNKRIGVITCADVSTDGRMILRRTFDDFFFMDESAIPGWNYGQCSDEEEKEIRAKVFSFSLEMFRTCILLGPNTLVLENIDGMFQGQVGWSNGFLDPVKFKPSMEVFYYLVEKFVSSSGSYGNANDFLATSLNGWVENNLPGDKSTTESWFGISVLHFSVEKCKLSTTCENIYGHPVVVKLTDIPGTYSCLAERLMALKDSVKLGLTERMIITTWLQIFEERVSGTMTTNDESMSEHVYENEPVAIIGMSCRFPGANNLDEFWNLLYDGREGIRQPPPFRWTNKQSIFGGSGKENETNAGFLSAPVDEFDAKFFGISPKDAQLLDPQGRLLHELLWESLEGSGIDPLSLRESLTGIFVGSWMYDYKDIVQASDQRDFLRTYMGNSIGATAARLSFLLGLTGPNIATESGCSSAIVAVHMAVNSLRKGESNLALAGGVNLLLHPFKKDIVEYVIAPDGRCKTFDEKANGFGRAEGCGVLVMKRLSDALCDRDNIWAVVRGSAITQEGLSRSLGTPTVHCEALAMELALKDAGVRPEQVSFVETHGTGTSVGDPMEVAATAKAYHSNARKVPLIIGSVKTNVGHTESCAGITGMIKTILAMHHEVIPKHLNLERINPEVDLAAIPAIIPMHPISWPKVPGHPRIAGVSSFGITGTDGHVILEEPPSYELPQFHLGLERPLHLIKFSGKSKEAMQSILMSYKEYFRLSPDDNLANAAYTANTGRPTFNERAFILAGSNKEAAHYLQVGDLEQAEISSTNPGKICFLFTGQGSQYPGMAKDLYETSPVFRMHFDICDRILLETYNLSIRNALWEPQDEGYELSRTIYSQISIFCVEFCLLRLWQSWGVHPDYVLGHSLGEFCAAVAAGIITFEDALMLVAERSRLIDGLADGSMLVVKATLTEIENLMTIAKVDLDIAAENSNEQVVVAGSSDKIACFKDICISSGMKTAILHASHAFHSRHMDPMLDEYRKIAETVSHSHTTNCQYISAVKGKIIEDTSTEMNSQYWIEHTRKRVCFLTACKSILKSMQYSHFLEIGPQPILSSFIMQNANDTPVSCYPSLRRNGDDWRTILTSLGKLYLQGVKIDWEGFDRPYTRRKIPSSLPFHPFHRKSFWVDCTETNLDPLHPLIGFPFKNASTFGIFQNNFSLKSAPYVRDHCMGSVMLLPGAIFAEMCFAAGYCVANSLTSKLEQPRRPISLENLTIAAPLEMKEDTKYPFQMIVQLVANASDEEGSASNVGRGFLVQVFRENNEEIENNIKWVLHASAEFHPVANTKDILGKWRSERVKEIMKDTETLSTDDVYERIESAGMKLGSKIRSIQRYWIDEVEGDSKREELVAEIRAPGDHESYILHPIIIDACFQSAVFATVRQTHYKGLTLPLRVGKMIWLDAIDEKCSSLYLHLWWEESDTCSVFILNGDLTPVAFMMDIQVIETTVKTVESMLQQQRRILPDSWEEVWKQIQGPNDGRMKLSSAEPILQSEELKEKLRAIENRTCSMEKDHFTKLNRLVYLYTLRALFQLEWKPEPELAIHVDEFCAKYGISLKFLQLIRFYFSMFLEEHGIIEMIANGEDKRDLWILKDVVSGYQEKVEKEVETLHDELQKEKGIGDIVNFYKFIGNELSEILGGHKSALSILFPDHYLSSSSRTAHQDYSAEMYYQHHPCREECESKVVEILGSIFNHIVSQNATNSSSSTEKKVYRVLEVGAGTCSMSVVSVPLLANVFGTQFEYYFTDISPSFFPKAEIKLEKFQTNLKFCVFNIEESPMEQGIPLNYFDMVLASDVLHASKDLTQCLQNLRQTLKPHGTLFFNDCLTEDRGLTFVFGLMDGFWRFEDFEWRQHHTYASGETWRKLLLQSGFEYVNISEVYLGTMGCITAGASSSSGYEICAANNSHLGSDRKKWVVFAHQADFVIETVAKVLQFNGSNVIVVLPAKNMENDDRVNDAIRGDDIEGIIYAWALDGNLVDQKQIAEPFMQIAKHISNLTKPPKLFVFTKGAHGILEAEYVNLNPSGATLFGMVKALKNENFGNLLVRYVDLDDLTSQDNATLDSIFFELAMCRETKEKERLQVAYRAGVRYEPRLRKAMMQNPTSEDLQLPVSTDRYQILLPESRLINDLSFIPLDEETVGDLDVEVSMRAYSLNFRDLFSVLKPSQEFENLNAVGLDFSGVVSKVGKLVRPDVFQVGDRVFGMNSKNARLPSHLVIESDCLLRVPPTFTFHEAATVPAIFCTGLHCLLAVAKLQQGETVLIHTGSGGVGLSSIQIAKYVGAKIITTAGNPRKRAYLKSLGIEHVFNSRDTSFRQEIMKVTNGRGVDVVLNSLTSPGFKEATLSVCTKNARFVEMSKLAVWPPEVVRERRPDVEYTVVDLSISALEHRKELLKQLEEFLYNGHFKVIPNVTFDALRIRQAFQYFQKARHIGKVILTMPEVKATEGQWKTHVPLFNGFSTYLITGGLGGIGFEVCKWMLEKGATDIVLIGRNSPKPEICKEIENLNKGNRYKVMIRLGDIGDYDQCKSIIDEIAQIPDQKPIRGIQHCAGVLRDNLYGNQTWESFEATFNPKVKGTWNLHNLTRNMQLEHFVLYSSVTALAGTPGQANHAAANCFEDAFAHYRYSLILPATSINWGQWSQVGCAKDVNVPGVLPVSVKRMLNGLEAALRSPRIQVAFGDFESFSTWMIACPMFKYYLDERLLKKLKDGDGKQSNKLLPNSSKFWQEMDDTVTEEEKTGIISHYIRLILRGALRLDPDEAISDDANMQDLGVDSLMLIELKNSLQSLLGSRFSLTANMLKDCHTIRDLSKVVVSRICEGKQGCSTVGVLPSDEFENLLRGDCSLPDSIQASRNLGRIRTVLVTGCTGQLGPYILSTLCKPEYKTVDKIVCLIRTEMGSCPRSKLEAILESMNLFEHVDMNKLECLRGDVTLGNFGLQDDHYKELCDSIDAVIHLAGKSDYLEPYRPMEADNISNVNVGGTLNILKFASSGKAKRVYFASTMLAIFGGNNEGTLCEDWPNETQIRTVAENSVIGYPACKFVGEMLLRQANERGIPCKVFRFPWIMGDSKTGQLNFKSNYCILRFVSYLMIKAIPVTPVPALVLPADVCAELSLELFLNENVPNDVYNIMHPDPDLEVEFATVAKKDFGVKIDPVDWKNEEFMEKLYGTQMPLSSVKSVYTDVDRGAYMSTSDAFPVIQGYLEAPDEFFRNSKLEKYIPGYSVNIPSSMDIIRTNLAYVKSTGFLKDFGL